MYLQYCKVCQSYKAPRSHHCRKCNRCVMKMDHHCPWINNCCGYQNHASFTLFLLLAPLGCIHASFIFVMTMYTQLYNRISFGWSSVKIDMSAAKRDPRPIIPFGLSAFAASLFALGLALGTTIAVGMLFIIQMKVILTNKTSIESWIEEKAKDRIQYYQTGETFIFPYDMGSKWKNFRQVFTWSGVPEGDGLDWPVRDGCHQYSLTIEQLKQKADKRIRSVRYRAIEDYSGVCCPVTKGVKTFFTTPCTEEPRIALSKGDLILATRGLKHWMYGEKILDSTADASDLQFKSCVMDETALSLGTIDVSYLSTSAECSISRCKHSSEEWGECNSRPPLFRSATLKWKETLLSRKRPFVGRCCYVCTPQSRDNFFNASIPSLGLRNVIYINETHTRYRGWLARRLCYVLFVQERDVHKGMFAKNLTENVLNSSRVQKAILDEASEPGALGSFAEVDPKAINKVKKKARKILQEMVATVSPALIRLTGWVLLKLFNSFFWNIQIHRGQIEMVKAATEMNLPLIFLPVHKSHIDYLLLTFILFCHNIKAPYIAAGNNLNIPILSTLIRKLGGFFIRRKLDQSPDGRKDFLYRALLYVHIEELLRQQQFLEIFLEGTRSRSGKASGARAGLLSVVVDALFSNATPDVLIIPVGISYDRIIEGHYNSEQLGKPKKNESLWSIARGVFRMLRKNYGCVRVDFAQPFSLKEYVNSQSQKPVPAPFSLEQALLPAILPSRPHDSVDGSAEASLPNSRDITSEPFRRELIANLAEHILFTANKSCAVMSTHLVACLLLYRHRQGTDLSRLVEDFFSMKEEVLARDFDLGFSGNSDDVVMHAIHLLGNCVNITNTSRNNEFFITPSTTIPAVFELNFYSNGVLHVFIKEAVIACSLHAVQSRRYRNGTNGASPSLISQEHLVRKAASLCYLLSNEFTVSLPCQVIYQVCHESVERLIQYGILLVAEQDDQEDVSPSLPEQQWDKKIPEPLSWRSDEEDEDSDFGEEQRDCYLKVSQSQEHQQYITFLQRLLGPLLEAYSSAVTFVHNFSGPIAESEYLQKLHRHLISRTEKNVAVYAESATYSHVKNAVKVFKEIGVFNQTKQRRDTILELSTAFLPQHNRQKLLEFIMSFMVL